MSLLCKSIMQGTLEDVKKYWCEDNISLATICGLHPIFLASVRGDEEIMEFQLTYYDTEPLEVIYKKKALMMAIEAGNGGIVRLLLESGVSREMFKKAKAKNENHEDVSDTIAEGIDAGSPLHAAAAHGHVVIVRMLLGFGFSVEDMEAGPHRQFVESYRN